MCVLLDALSAETVMMDTYCGLSGCWYSPHVHVDAGLLLRPDPAIELARVRKEIAREIESMGSEPYGLNGCEKQARGFLGHLLAMIDYAEKG